MIAYTLYSSSVIGLISSNTQKLMADSLTDAFSLQVSSWFHSLHLGATRSHHTGFHLLQQAETVSKQPVVH